MASTPIEAANALDVAGLSFRFGSRPALDDVSLTVTGGVFNVLLGLNGAGKTTLYSLVTRLYHPQQGRIRILGHDLSRQPGQALKHIGVVFQTPTLDLDLTVAQNLRYHAALHGLSNTKARARIDASLDRHELSELIGKTIAQLSGGQRRRVELARALLHEPRLLLLDEATVGLDIRSRREFIAHVRSLCSREGVGVLWATHLIDEVDDTDNVIVLHQGKMLRSGVVRDLVDELDASDISGAFTLLTTRS